MFRNSSRWRRAAVLLAGALALAACDDKQIAAPKPEMPGGDGDIALALSSQMAHPGERFAVSVEVSSFGKQPIGALQGRLYFDASRATYIGQSLDDGFVLVNDTKADQGELRLVATHVTGFGPRVATFVFEARRTQYAGGFRFSNEELANVKGQVMAASMVGMKIARDLAPRALGEARRMTVQDWAIRLDDPRDHGKPIDIALRPGEYLLNLTYGDANLSGSVTGTDALIVSQVAVGLREIIVGSDGSPHVDVAVAGNVAPANTPGLGEVGDAVPPGLNADGTRTLTGTDALLIRQKAVNLTPDVAGQQIPGRGPIATNRVHVAAGSHAASEHWTADNVYVLDGVVQFTGGAVLTIDAGTRVEGVGLQTTGTLSALQIARDATIQAVGTPLQPIVFTCEGVEPKPKGCWGGLWIAGNAVLNEGTTALGNAPTTARNPNTGTQVCPAGNTGFQRAGEATNPQVLFGGCNNADNSGTLQYAVIEYAGWTFATNVELNGLTLGAVGSGTTIDHIQVHAGQDDAVELFGGTVNLKYLYLTANSDDNFDISFGWSGSAQFIVIQQDLTDGDKGLEADNTETTASYGNTPRTTGAIWNVTMIGGATTSGIDPVTHLPIPTTNDALHVRRGTGPFVSNWLIVNNVNGMDLDDAATCASINSAGGLNVRNSIFASVGTLGNTDSGDPNPCGPYASATGVEAAMITDAANANTVTAATAADIMVSPTDVLLPDFRPKAGQATGGGTPPGGFLDASATYVGAVAPANSTKSNIPWYSGWTRGWFSATQP
ncbi:MAG TPA: hypothetical protein VFT29_07425 [Gemmatimonadaceae bacterium]|nr:hypothetical protein [Gemmatimonadaceae bacterium]